jgi:hypothetical protein
VDETVRDRSELSLVEDTDEELAIDEQDLVLLGVRTPELVLDLVLRGEVEAGSVLRLDVEEDGRDLRGSITNSQLDTLQIIKGHEENDMERNRDERAAFRSTKAEASRSSAAW